MSGYKRTFKAILSFFLYCHLEKSIKTILLKLIELHAKEFFFKFLQTFGRIIHDKIKLQKLSTVLFVTFSFSFSSFNMLKTCFMLSVVLL